MAKLITPFVYDDKLSGLAVSFPLSLTDEVKQVITLPVCDIQPADSKQPVVGRFLRGTQQGALLATEETYLTNYVEKEQHWGRFNQGTQPLAFGRTVSGVVLIVTIYTYPDRLQWCSSTGRIFYEYLALGAYYIPFKGSTVYFRKKWTNGNIDIIGLGFY